MYTLPARPPDLSTSKFAGEIHSHCSFYNSQWHLEFAFVNISTGQSVKLRSEWRLSSDGLVNRVVFFFNPLVVPGADSSVCFDRWVMNTQSL